MYRLCLTSVVLFALGTGASFAEDSSTPAADSVATIDSAAQHRPRLSLNRRLHLASECRVFASRRERSAIGKRDQAPDEAAHHCHTGQDD